MFLNSHMPAEQGIFFTPDSISVISQATIAAPFAESRHLMFMHPRYRGTSGYGFEAHV
jgi:hypothetical protein